MVEAVPTDVMEAAQAAGQDHVFKDWESLSSEQQASLLKDVQAVDFKHLEQSFTSSQQAANKAVEAVEPAQGVTALKDLTDESRAAATQQGYKLIAEGKLGVLLLAGGQGTRLGSSAPKGCYDIGLPSGSPLFALQAHRIRRLQSLAARTVGGDSAEQKPMHWYIMTSPATDAATQEYFQQHQHFGLQPSQVHFFQQGQMPCITEEGKIFKAEAGRLAWAPDGNGGLYSALQRQGLLQHMAEAGVEAVDCVSVDNALVAPGDPLFAGHCWLEGAECGAKVVAKAYPEEKVGVFATQGGEIKVVEYSELGPDLAAKADENGELLYNWSNVCMHYFRRDFLEAVAMRLHTEGHFHIARKSIPSVDGPVKGIKLELFIFDTFPMASKVSLLEAPRVSQFAPVKNKEGQDSPATAREALLKLHSGWVRAAGGAIDGSGDEAVVEVPALLSYGGEGLDGVCSGRTFTAGTVVDAK
eukprot:CAMPEP_0206140996 /NCGR_PEP_ID=MMETSP1473-20131121/11448_1 /ASSEMBLY_ACC=CAM_ASM_001109 /TAXON_ID=1461547 /ORGANISM="Stichococcus sp, Strain RCC1054" /LENGTH=469 /DNA_ID=CAMNT_0053535381 /DNA_START=218 /DNA_END=1627 /DNA_ORIENTATION=+